LVTITAKTISNAIARKHSNDLVVPECKTGPTWFNNELRKLDVWILRRSWVRFGTVGYEIKITRSDFLRDKKWPEYLQYCHEFFFVCPWGMIKPEEITDKAVGLYWISKNGKRLFLQWEARHRDIELPDLLVYHILMSRVTLIRPHEFYRMRNERDWLQKEVDNFRHVRKERDQLSKQIDDMKKEMTV